MNESIIHSYVGHVRDLYPRQQTAYVILVKLESHFFNAHQISIYFTVALILVQFNGAPLLAPTAII